MVLRPAKPQISLHICTLCLLEYIEYIVAVSKNRCFKFADITFKLVDNLMVFLKEFVEKVDFEEKKSDDKKSYKISQ